MVICMSINHHYQSMSDKSYSSMFCSCVCQGSERVRVEKNHMNFFFAKMHDMPKFIQSLECQYMLIYVLRLGYSSDISLYGNGEVGDCGWMEYIRA